MAYATVSSLQLAFMQEKAAHIRARPRPVLQVGVPRVAQESDLRGADPLVCIRCSQDLVIACQNWGLALENFGKTKFFKQRYVGELSATISARQGCGAINKLECYGF